jgi:hypothetical protein
MTGRGLLFKISIKTEYINNFSGNYILQLSK